MHGAGVYFPGTKEAGAFKRPFSSKIPYTSSYTQSQHGAIHRDNLIDNTDVYISILSFYRVEGVLHVSSTVRHRLLNYFVLLKCPQPFESTEKPEVRRLTQI
jgi:hypothetical protein